MKQKVGVRFVIDGSYTYHIDNYLTESYRKQINWKGLKEYIREYITNELNDENITVSISAKCFFGSPSTNSERTEFYARLGHAGIDKRELGLRTDAEKGLKEDAVDTQLIVDTLFHYFQESEFDYLVLFAGDSDFVPMTQALRNNGVKVIIVYMDCKNAVCHTRTSQVLLEEADAVISIEHLVSDRVHDSAHKAFDNVEGTECNITWEVIQEAISRSRRDNSNYSPIGDIYRNIKSILKTDWIPSPVNQYLEQYKSRLDIDNNRQLVRYKPDYFRRYIQPSLVRN